ncbi:MAG: hypothetical protein ACTHOD_21075 [Motilibacteraceae bacterium]
MLGLGTVLAVAVGGTVPAQAAPTRAPLPDATMYCGPTHEAVDYEFPVVGADAVWLRSGPYQGRWSFVSYQHYVAEGQLIHDYVPVEQLPALYGPSVGGKSFGTKAGMDQRLACEIVSRWGGPQPYTVIGPVLLART